MHALPLPGKLWLVVATLLAVPAFSRADDASGPAAHKDDDRAEETTPAAGMAGNEKALDMLAERLQSSDSFKVRAQAAVLLGKFGDKRHVMLLVKTLQYDEHFVVRAAAATALGSLGDERAVEPLFMAAAEQEPIIRDSCARALAKLDARNTFETLSNYARNGTVEQRAVAIGRAGDLARTGDEAAIDLLVTALGDERPVREAAAAALSDLATDRALPILVGGLENESPAVRAECARLLGPRRDPRAVEALAIGYDRAGEQERVRAEIRRSLERLRPLVNMDDVAVQARKAPDKQLRARAIRLMGIVGDPRTANALEEMLNDPDPFIVGTLALSLADLGSVSSIPRLEETLTTVRGTRAEAPVDLALKKLRRLRELSR